MTIEIQSRREGVVIRIRAQAGARNNDVRGEQDGALKVAVTQAPEKGKANKAILELLAQRLRVRKSQLELVAGETSASKQILVRGVSAGELAERLAALALKPL